MFLATDKILVIGASCQSKQDYSEIALIVPLAIVVIGSRYER